MREPAGQIELAAIGRVESPLTDAASAPNQGDEGAPDATPIVDVEPVLSSDVAER
jgi:hypothetical protein